MGSNLVCHAQKHCKINDKSIEKRMHCWTDSLIDFWIVFAMDLGAILALKIDEKSIKRISKILMNCLMLFLAKMPPK